VHAHFDSTFTKLFRNRAARGWSVANGDLQGPNDPLMNQEESPVHSDIGSPVFSTKVN
jgi:hypothetical protein